MRTLRVLWVTGYGTMGMLISGKMPVMSALERGVIFNFMRTLRVLCGGGLRNVQMHRAPHFKEAPT